MKIKKLRINSQFIDEIKLNKDVPVNGIKFELIVKYNDSLKQKPTKEMFFNEFEEPNIDNFKSSPFCESGDCKAYRDEVEAYKAAEKKVMFKGWEWYDNTKNNNSIKSYVKKDNYIIHFHDHGDVVLYIESHNNHWCLKTLEDLANATNGELNINIDI